MKADLHIHTTASDGAMSPTKIVQWAKKSGIEAMAITDHDTVSGIDEAKIEASKAGIRFVVGIEISAYSNTEIHILGYGIDYKNANFVEELDAVQNYRIQRNVRIGQKLKELGVTLDFDFEAKGVGRMNIARQMVKEGYAGDINEVFAKYLGVGALAYFATRRVMPIEAVKLIKKYGGVACIAHPKKFLQDGRLEMLISGLKPFGLDGLEVDYPGHSEQDKKALNALCAKYRLVATGGSDFHGEEDKDFTIELDDRTAKRLKMI